MPITPLKEVMCNIEERYPFDLKEWSSHETNDIATLRQRLDDMKLVGRTISDFRLTSFCYNMRVDDIEDTVYNPHVEMSDEERDDHAVAMYANGIDDL